MGARKLSNEQLLKRASHAGRNLSVLALLASSGAVALWVAVMVARQDPWFLAVPAMALSFIAAGYWLLAVAGRRGNPDSVAVVIVIIVVQFVVSVLSAGVEAARSGTDFASSFNLVRLGIPILVLIALEGSRRVLLQLQERGLWERASASFKPSRALCSAGGIVLALGFITLNVGMAYPGLKIEKVRAAEHQDAAKFVQMVQNEEKEFITAASAVVKGNNRAELDRALEKAAALETRLKTLRDEARDSRLQAILVTYGNGLQRWKTALLILREPSRDVQKARQMLLLGDKLRAEAASKFDRQFVWNAAQAKPDIY